MFTIIWIASKWKQNTHKIQTKTKPLNRIATVPEMESIIMIELKRIEQEDNFFWKLMQLSHIKMFVWVFCFFVSFSLFPFCQLMLINLIILFAVASIANEVMKCHPTRLLRKRKRQREREKKKKQIDRFNGEKLNCPEAKERKRFQSVEWSMLFRWNN